jgi:hypothetical protein
MREQKNRSPKTDSQEISLDKWGMQLMENILLIAAEALAQRNDQNLESAEVTLKFRIAPDLSKDQLEVRVGFEQDPTLVTYVPRQFG